LPFTARLYEPLFTVPDPDGAGGDLLDHVNEDALRELEGLVEPSVQHDPEDTRYQFERLGYFWRDPVDGRGRGDEAGARLVFNRIVGLKDTRARRVTDAEPARDAKAPGRAAGADARDAAAEAFDPKRLAPEERAAYERYVAELGLQEADAALLATRPPLARFFEESVAAGAAVASAANWVVNEVARELQGEGAGGLTPAALAELTELVDAGTITLRGAKELFPELLQGADPRRLVAERGLERLDDEAAVRQAVGEAVAAHPDEVAAYRGGKQGLKGFFVGQVMRATGGRADPALV